MDYHLHPISHGEGSHTREILQPFFEEAQRKGIEELGFADHGRYYMEFDYQTMRDIAETFPTINVRFGIELPFLVGCDEELGEIVETLKPDFVIGSLHHIDGWMFDHPGFMEGYSKWDMDDLYKRYYALMKRLVQVEHFDIIGHLDLIKVFGFAPKRDTFKYVEPVLQEIAKEGKTIELNTAGFRKPVKEFYPSLFLLKECRRLHIPVTLGSDAHTPHQVGFMFKEAKRWLLEAGYTHLTTFSKRRPWVIDI